SYDEFHEKDNDDNYCYLPEWYEFYDGRLGTGVLMLLPDLREPRDRVYFHKACQEQMEKQQAQQQQAQQAGNPAPVQKVKPNIPYHDHNWMWDFVRKTEDAYVQRVMEGYLKKLN